MLAQRQRLKVLSAGILSLILTMGIARFAYTPMLPVMQLEAGLDVAGGGWLAAVNYIGYLLGAIITSLISDLRLKDRLYRGGLVVGVVTTLGMGLTTDIYLWGALRFFAGFSAAAGTLIGTGLILHWLIRNDHKSELGLHFAGVGLGIALGALAVEVMSQTFSWDQQWFILSAIGLVLLIPAWAWLPPPEPASHSKGGVSMHDRPPGRTFMRLFHIAYFCAGVGYAVSATFIVAIIDKLPGMNGGGNWSFLLLGLAAAPACLFWDLVARRIGELNALLAVYSLKTVSILLPILAPEPWGPYLGAALFGFTFIGIVSLVLSMAGRYYPSRPAKMMGKLTIAFGIAQIIAPALTGLLAEKSGSYADGLYFAAAFMLLGTFTIFAMKRLQAREPADTAAI